MLIQGGLDASGSPIVTIRVAGALGSKTYQAVIDTGFTGFVELPLLEMVELGLRTEGAANVMLGDGSVTTNYLSSASVYLGAQVESGTVLLAENSSGVLIGMAFLREFKVALIVTSTAVALFDRQESLDVVAKLMDIAP
jgi:predicted aspartyl protease